MKAEGEPVCVHPQESTHHRIKGSIPVCSFTHDLLEVHQGPEPFSWLCGYRGRHGGERSSGNPQQGQEAAPSLLQPSLSFMTCSFCFSDATFSAILPGMRILVNLLLDTLPMLGNVLLLCFFVFFIFGIIGVQLWAGLLRNRCFLEENFTM